MFLQLVTVPPPPAPQPPFSTQDCINSLFLYTPLQTSALVETVWRNRYNAQSTNFAPWPRGFTDQILGANFSSGYDFTGAVPAPLSQFPLVPVASFVPPNQLPGVALTAGGDVRPTNWDHLIYAYLIENTRILDIFARLLETYAFSEELETPSPASQNFWRNVEYLIYGDGIPSMIWNTTSRARRDEIANRQTVYNWMFGIDLSHAAELAKAHPYLKPTASNRDFFPTFEAFAREVWGGIMNSKNTSGANPTDPAAVATLARRLFDMMATRRINGNLSREEYRSVAVMSYLHLAVSYDSQPIIDLKATASSPEQRLAKLAERVRLTTHTKAKPLFDLAQPFSLLLQSIEQSSFNDAVTAQLLYDTTLPGNFAANSEVVIDQYSLATGRDLKASSIVERQRQRPAAPRPPALASSPTNGRQPALTR